MNINNKSKKHIPTFKNAQELFYSYSTLQSDSMLEKKLSNTIDLEILENFKNKKTRDIYNTIILKYYPNEISVKSNFINHVLFKSNNHVTIFELPIGNSRIDLCKINGSSIAYEIKTDLDNLVRLNKQLNDYLEIFEKVFIICSINRLPDILRHVDLPYGIYTYSISKFGNYKFKLFRNASLSININSEKQLKILRKRELIKHYSIAQGFTNRNEITKLILENYSSNQINEIFKHILKERYKQQWDFLKSKQSQIYEIDYQWFYKNTINPDIIYL